MQTRQTNHHRLPVRLPPSTHEKLVQYADENNCSMNAAIVSLIEQALSITLAPRQNAHDIASVIQEAMNVSMDDFQNRFEARLKVLGLGNLTKEDILKISNQSRDNK